MLKFLPLLAIFIAVLYWLIRFVSRVIKASVRDYYVKKLPYKILIQVPNSTNLVPFWMELFDILRQFEGPWAVYPLTVENELFEIVEHTDFTCYASNLNTLRKNVISYSNIFKNVKLRICTKLESDAVLLRLIAE
jgi:hypothetical protein